MRSTPGGSCAAISLACSAETRRLLGAKTNPRASAPASMEARASSMHVVAQNLIQIRIDRLSKESVACDQRTSAPLWQQYPFSFIVLLFYGNSLRHRLIFTPLKSPCQPSAQRNREICTMMFPTDN